MGTQVATPERAPFETAEAATQIRALAAHHPRHVEPAGNCQIGTAAEPASAKVRHAASSQEHGPRCQNFLAVDGRREVASADPDQRVLSKLQARTGQSDLERGFVLCIAHQEVGQPMRVFVHHSAYRDTETLVAVAPQVLQGGQDSRAMNLQPHWVTPRDLAPCSSASSAALLQARILVHRDRYEPHPITR